MKFSRGKICALVGLLLCSCRLAARSAHRDKIQFIDDLTYSAQTDRDHGFDLYLPKHGAQPFPVAIFIHGGYWRNQSRSYYRSFTGLYENFGLALASRGVATAVIDYRTYPKGSIEDQYSDIAAAVQWIREHAAEYGGDAKRLCLVGHSAGGHLALMHAWRQAFDVRCAVALSPILDISHMRHSNDEAFNGDISLPVFGSGARDHAHSPVRYVNPSVPPTLLLFGAADLRYLLEQADSFRTRLAAENLRSVQISIVPKLDHSDMVLAVNGREDPLSDTIANFITTDVRGGNP